MATLVLLTPKVRYIPPPFRTAERSFESVVEWFYEEAHHYFGGCFGTGRTLLFVFSLSKLYEVLQGRTLRQFFRLPNTHMVKTKACGCVDGMLSNLFCRAKK